MWGDPALRSLTAPQKVFFLVCYTVSVEKKTTVLPPAFNMPALADRAGIDKRSAQNAFHKCIEAGLIESHSSGRIHVLKVRENHEKLTGWTVLEGEMCRPGDALFGSPCGADTGEKRTEKESEEKIEKSEQKTESGGDGPEGESPDIPPVSDPESARAAEILSSYSVLESVRYLCGNSKIKPATKTLEELAQNVPEAEARKICAYVYALRLAGRLKKGAGALLTSMMTKACIEGAGKEQTQTGWRNPSHKATPDYSKGF
jgi:hypothetical protein